ncbi:unnamed protein product [Urochloa humidicola]
MEDDEFDSLGHDLNYGGSHCGPGGWDDIDLNSQASAANRFSEMRAYGSFLQSDDIDLNPTRVHPPMNRRLNFGSSSTASGAGVPTWQNDCSILWKIYPLNCSIILLNESNGWPLI